MVQAGTTPKLLAASCVPDLPLGRPQLATGVEPYREAGLSPVRDGLGTTKLMAYPTSKLPQPLEIPDVDGGSGGGGGVVLTFVIETPEPKPDEGNKA